VGKVGPERRGVMLLAVEDDRSLDEARSTDARAGRLLDHDRWTALEATW